MAQRLWVENKSFILTEQNDNIPNFNSTCRQFKSVVYALDPHNNYLAGRDADGRIEMIAHVVENYDALKDKDIPTVFYKGGDRMSLENRVLFVKGRIETDDVGLGIRVFSQGSEGTLYVITFVCMSSEMHEIKVNGEIWTMWKSMNVEMMEDADMRIRHSKSSQCVLS